jgi:hypothetical protein
MAEEKQAVVTETDSQAKPGTEATDARDKDDLNSLLDEWKTSSEPSKSTPEQKTDADTKSDGDDRLARLERRLEDQQFKSDIAPVLASFRDQIPDTVLTDKELTNLINGWAIDDPRLRTAWLNRHDDPGKWGRTVKGLSDSFKKRFSTLPDKSATEDREAVTAAVRGASTKAPEDRPPSYGNASNSDFASDVEKRYGYRPSV